jgi:SAM-dependent methyltransferase
MDFPVDEAVNFLGGGVGDVLHVPDLEWDGKTIPLESSSIDCALATEVFEHCQVPEMVMAEILRVLKPGGIMFFTVPFFWPLHCVPFDEYRYTPYSFERHLKNAGFQNITIKGLSGWDASLAQMIGLYVRRRPMSRCKRFVLSCLAQPLVFMLARRDKIQDGFCANQLPVGLSGVAYKGAE